MSDDESLITPAMRAAIGREGTPATITIDRERVRRLAEALEEDDPTLLAALADAAAPVVAPPYALILAISRLDQVAVPDEPRHSLIAADEWLWIAPIDVGDVLTIVPRIADIQERIGGRVGHSLFAQHEWTCTNQRGVIVARVRRTMTHFPERMRE